MDQQECHAVFSVLPATVIIAPASEILYSQPSSSSSQEDVISNFSNAGASQPVDYMSVSADEEIEAACSNQSQVLQCEQCAAVFEGEAQLIRHLLCHTTILPVRCQLCRKDFTKQSRLAEHFMCVHAGVKRFVCSFCSARFSWRSTYMRHLRRQHNSGHDHPSTSASAAGETSPFNSLQLECEHCPLAFAQRRELVKHVRQNHKDELREQAQKVEQCAAGKVQSDAFPVGIQVQQVGAMPCVLPAPMQVPQFVPQVPPHQIPGVTAISGMPGMPLQVQVSLPLQPPFQCPMCSLIAPDHTTLAQHVGTHISVTAPPPPFQPVAAQLPQQQRVMLLAQSATSPASALQPVRFTAPLPTHATAAAVQLVPVDETAVEDATPSCLPTLHCPLCNLSMPSRAALEQHVNKECTQSDVAAASIRAAFSVQLTDAPTSVVADHPADDAAPPTSFELYFDEDEEPRVLLKL